MTANSQALRELADDIERDGAEQPLFCMDNYISGPGELEPICQTAACIAGYALFKLDREHFLTCANNSHGTGFGYPERMFVRDRFGLTEAQADGMFTPNVSFNLITKEVAATMLRWLADNPDATASEIQYAWWATVNPDKALAQVATIERIEHDTYG